MANSINNSLSQCTVFLVPFQWARQPFVTPGLVHVELRSKITAWTASPWDLKLWLPAVKPYIFIAFPRVPFKLQFLLTDLGYEFLLISDSWGFPFFDFELGLGIYIFIFCRYFCVLKWKARKLFHINSLSHIHPILLNTNAITLLLMGTHLLKEQSQSLYLVIFLTPHPGGILAPKLHLQSYP